MYFDTSYLVRLYYDDPGFEKVREIAATAPIACCILGRAETTAALHRKLREGSLTAAVYRVISAEFLRESEAGAYRWFPFSNVVVERVERVYATLGSRVFLRAADAVHLACAQENGFREIYSNDTKLLAAAVHFGLQGVNVIT